MTEKRDDMKEMLSTLNTMANEIQMGKTKCYERMEQLKQNGYDYFDEEGTPDKDHVLRVLAQAVNDKIEEKVHIKDQKKVHELLEIPEGEDLENYFHVVNKDWEKSLENATSLLDMAQLLKGSAPQRRLVKPLIEHQFKIRWNTETGEPNNYPTNYEFCDSSENGEKLLKYIPRQAHVKATLYRECKYKNVKDLQAIKSEELCPTVYIRTTSGWKTWQADNDEDTFEAVDIGENLPWLNESIKNYIDNNADEQKDDEDSLQESLEKPTLYWAVLNDEDFISGQKLKLKDIGKSQVYVGKADNGIKGRWINDGGNHCAKMKKCLDNVCAMTTYDPLRLDGIQLVDARLTLAKVRKGKTALFVVKTFGDEVEKAEIAAIAEQEAKEIVEEETKNEESANQDYDKAVTRHYWGQQSNKSKKYMNNVSKELHERHRELEEAVEDLQEAKAAAREATEKATKAAQNAKKHENATNSLETAEKFHRKGKISKHKNIIPYKKYNMTWRPTKMEYGMNMR